MPPITADDFDEKGTEITERETNQVKQGVVDYLRENSGQAHSTKDIHESTGFNRATVNQVCLKLHKAGVTNRKSVDGTIYNQYLGEPTAAEPAEE